MLSIRTKICSCDDDDDESFLAAVDDEAVEEIDDVEDVDEMDDVEIDAVDDDEVGGSWSGSWSWSASDCCCVVGVGGGGGRRVAMYLTISMCRYSMQLELICLELFGGGLVVLLMLIDKQQSDWI
jgi:hypothetical protein